MNTDKTLRNKFIDRKDFPIWYYKELQSVSVDYVIWNLLKESFVVDIDGSKHEITFGKNRKNEIGQCIIYDDIKSSKLCSYEVVLKGFREGQWFIVSDIDTTEDFKIEYNKRKEEYEKASTKKMYVSILKNVIESIEDLTKNQKDKYLLDIENSSYEELENYMNNIMQKC